MDDLELVFVLVLAMDFVRFSDWLLELVEVLRLRITRSTFPGEWQLADEGVGESLPLEEEVPV